MERWTHTFARRRLTPCTMLLALLAGLLTPAFARAPSRVEVLDIDGAIGPAVADYVTRELHALEQNNVRLAILRVNTPGGLDSSMREIIRAMLASPVPVAVYVAPSGARAASAGTYIVYASAVAAMAPGTNLGAATPIRIGGLPQLPSPTPEKPAEQKPGDKSGNADEPTDTETRKSLNDAVAYIRSLAELHGRNADWAEEAVRHSVSIPASEALKLNVIDVIADDVGDLIRKIDGRTVVVNGKPQRLATSGLEVAMVKPDWRTDLLAVITDPNVAFLLMLAGVYGLLFEFLSPGAVAPGVIGAICLLVALFALNMLPISYAGAALVLLGIGLMVAEVHIGAFGAIGIGGILAFVIGAIMMFPSGAPGGQLALPVVATATLATAAFFLLGLSLLLRARRRPVVTGEPALLGAQGEIVGWQGDEGRVRVFGEMWRTRAAQPLQKGTRVRVVSRDGLVLVVEPV